MTDSSLLSGSRCPLCKRRSGLISSDRIPVSWVTNAVFCRSALLKFTVASQEEEVTCALEVRNAVAEVG